MRPLVSSLALVSTLALLSQAALAAPPAANPKSLASGAYVLLINPKIMSGQSIKAVRPGVVPVTIKTDGKTMVVGGKRAPNMTGSMVAGQITLAHVPGVTFSMTGSTFNGYAASGTFKSGKPGALSGTWALVSLSKAGGKFVAVGGPGATGQSLPSGASLLAGYAPAGAGGSWGYDGPGLNMGNGSANGDAFGMPGSVSGNAAGGGKDKPTKSDTGSWYMHPIDTLGSMLDGKGDGSSPSGGTDGGSQKDAAAAFKNSSYVAPGSAAAPADTGGAWWCLWLCGGSSDSSSSAPAGGKFTAGDWEPAGGDTSPGQKPNTGNGQDGAGSMPGGTAGAGTLNRPGSGGDPSDFFKPAPGDILNTNKLFNGASDPTRGANFGR